jgi:hypothetical protein
MPSASWNGGVAELECVPSLHRGDRCESTRAGTTWILERSYGDAKTNVIKTSTILGSPGHAFPVAKETSGWSLVGKFDCPPDARGAISHRPATPATHVRGDPSGTDCVDEDSVAPQLVGKHERQGVERCFGRAIGGDATRHPGERTRTTGYVDDSTVLARAYQRQERERSSPRPEQIRVEGLANNLEVGLTSLLPCVVVDGGVVDQDVDAFESMHDLAGQVAQGVLLSDVQSSRKNVEALPCEDRGRLFTFRRLTRAKHHGISGCR